MLQGILYAVSLVGIRLQQISNEVHGRRGDSRHPLTIQKLLVIAAAYFSNKLLPVQDSEWLLAGEQFVKDYTEGPGIDLMVVPLALQNLWGNIR